MKESKLRSLFYFRKGKLTQCERKAHKKSGKIRLQIKLCSENQEIDKVRVRKLKSFFIDVF